MSRARATSLTQRCASPLVLMNNVPPQYQTNRTPSPRVKVNEQAQSAVIIEQQENPFKYWQRTLEKQAKENAAPVIASHSSQAPKRTVSLGPRRGPLGEALQKSPFVSSSKTRQEASASFNQAAKELQSSLTELNKLIDDSTPPATRNRALNFEQSRVPIISRQADDDSPEPPPRWQWQEDLSNWKSSSSVNDLRSAFESPQPGGNNLRLNLPPKSGGDTNHLPPRSASPNVLRQKFELAGEQASSKTRWQAADYAIRRTTSVSSPSVSSTSSPASCGNQRPPPILRNPYRGQY